MDYLKIAAVANTADNQSRAFVACHVKARAIKNDSNATSAQVAWADSVRKNGDVGAALSNVLLMAIAASPSLLSEFNADGSLLTTEDSVATALQSAVDAVVDNDLAPYQND